MYQFLCRTALVVLTLGFMPASVRAQPILIGCTGSLTGQPMSTSRIVDVDIFTGAATNPRDTGIFFLAGISTQPSSGMAFGLTTLFSTPANSLVQIDAATGSFMTIGATGFPDIVEGDLAFHPSNGLLYGLQTGTGPGVQRRFFSINPSNGEGTMIGSTGSTGDLSAMAFSPNGTLYAIDTIGNGNSQLVTIDTVTGFINSSTIMNVNLGTVAALAFNPVDGSAFVADGSDFGTNMLYQLNVLNGNLMPIGQLGTVDGLSGLTFVSVPEPSSLLLVGTGSLAFLRWLRS